MTWGHVPPNNKALGHNPRGPAPAFVPPNAGRGRPLTYHLENAVINFDAKKPFKEATPDELAAFVGKRVRKVSGKPFSHGRKTARVTGVIEHPQTERPAFEFEDAEYCEALQCKLVEMATVVIDTWTESERGWGQRPDGGSIHASMGDYKSFVLDYWKREQENNPSGAVPDEYSRPDDNPRAIEIDATVLDRIPATGRWLTNAQLNLALAGENPYESDPLPVVQEPEADHAGSTEEGSAVTAADSQEMDEGEFEYVAYIADLFKESTREERLHADDDEQAQQKAVRLCKQNEVLAKVERAVKKRYRAMIKVTKLYRVFVEEDSFGEAKAEVEHQINEWADSKWEDRCYNEAEIESLEEA